MEDESCMRAEEGEGSGEKEVQRIDTVCWGGCGGSLRREEMELDFEVVDHVVPRNMGPRINQRWRLIRSGEMGGREDWLGTSLFVTT